MKRPGMLKTTLREKSKVGELRVPDLKAYYELIIIKTVWHWHQEWHIDQWNGTESRNIPTHIQTIEFWQFCWKVIVPTNGSGTIGYPCVKKKREIKLWSILSIKPNTIKLQKSIEKKNV